MIRQILQDAAMLISVMMIVAALAAAYFMATHQTVIFSVSL